MDRLGTAYLHGGFESDYVYIEGPQPLGFLIYTRCDNLKVSISTLIPVLYKMCV